MRTLKDFFSSQFAWTVGWEGATITVLEGPGQALNDPANAEIVNRLLGDLQRITTESFGMELNTKTDDSVRNHVDNVDSIAFLHEDDRILGFASSKSLPKEGVFYLHGVAVAQDSKRRGVGKKLICTLSNMANMRRIAFTTQNPIMFCLLRGLCTKVFPQPGNREVPCDFRELGTRLVAGRSGRIDPKSFVITGLYERCLYDFIPDSHDEPVNRWFATALDIKSGSTHDGFLFIGENGW